MENIGDVSLFSITDFMEKILLGGKKNDIGLFEWADGTLVRDQ